MAKSVEEVHGDATSYIYGCRCEPCTKAATARHKEAMDKLIERGIPDRVHGTLNGYTSYRCRCDECKKAGAKYHKERRRQQKDEF